MFKSYKKIKQVSVHYCVVVDTCLHVYVGTVILSLDLAAFIVIQYRNHYRDANHSFSHIVTALPDGTPL